MPSGNSGSGGGGQGGGPQAPQQSSANSKVGPYTPHTQYAKGDIILSAVAGWWVCTRPHTSGLVFTLRPGQSDDSWHWSLGPS